MGGKGEDGVSRADSTCFLICLYFYFHVSYFIMYSTLGVLEELNHSILFILCLFSNF